MSRANAAERGERGLSLKRLAVVLCGTITVYAAGMMLFVSLQLGRTSADIQAGLEPGRFLYEEVVARVHILTGAAFTARQILESDPAGRSDEVAFLRGEIDRYFVEHEFPPLEHLPTDAREAMILAQGHANQLEATVYEVLDLIDLGRPAAAAAAVRGMDSLRVLFDAQLTRAQLQSVRDLQSRQEALAASSRQMVIVLSVWLVVGVVGIAVIWFIVRWRVWQPLARLEDGLARVAQGDLHVEVAMRRRDEVGRLADHFNSMTAVLRQRAEEQGRFTAAGELIAGVAHEVNNPLMAIASMGEARLEDEDLPAEQRTELQHIVRQARRAGRLLSGLLRFVRVEETGQESADLNGVCQDAIDLASYRLNHETVALDVSLDGDLPFASGDPTRIEQVVVNLLGNALDALQDIAPPRRITMVTFARADTVHLTVEDNGPGIPAEIRYRLFHPFTTTKGKRGTGLGLYISRQIVRDLGGDLVLEPSETGARFVVSLPRSSVPADPDLTRSPPRAMARQHSLAGMRILLAEDEVGIRAPLTRYLSSRGARVFEAEDGLAALDIVAEEDLDALVVDLQMPRMDGIQVYRAVREDYPHMTDRVLVLTGDLAQIQDGPGADIDPTNVLIKPVRLSEVARHLHRLRSGEDRADEPDADREV